MKKQIDKIIKNNRIYDDPKKICDIFNEFYIQLTNENNFKYNVNEINKTINTNNEYTIFLKPTDAMDIFRIINSLKNTNAVGFDNITTTAIKLSAPYICQPLCYLINMSFEEGTFPNILKNSIVRPLFKKGDASDMNNYRPVTLIPILQTGRQKDKHFNNVSSCLIDIHTRITLFNFIYLYK
ncbi:unnamed protein product [Parnassius mnemosyne]|uniref:Reverse transcriptase domain-containing protein n=1 Tax=Parnassius mnemosyne TaxID=213953 RepID=A0AAV1KHW6_9NEOP